MGYVWCFVILIVSTCYYLRCSSALSWPHYEWQLGEKGCCPLAFLPLTSSGKIPKDAIIGGETKWDFEKVYYVLIEFEYSYDKSLEPYRPGHWVGVKTANPDSYPRFHWRGSLYECRGPGMYWVGDSSNYRYGVCFREISVLSNPYHCTIDYWERTYRYQEPVEAWDIFYPYIGFHYFAKRPGETSSYIGAGVVDKVNDYAKKAEKWVGYFHESHNGRLWNYSFAGTKILYINCTDSIPKILQSKVIGFNVNYDQLFTSADQPITLAKNTYTNNRDNDAEFKKTISHQLTTTLHMSMEQQSRWLNRIKTSFSADLSSPMLTTAFNALKLNLHGGFESEIEWEKLVKKGTSTTTSKTTIISDEIVVVVPPRTKVTLFVVQLPIKGSVPFTAKLKITSIANEMSTEDIIKALERIGNIETRIENGYVIVDVKGLVRVEYGWNTNTTMQFEPLTV